MPADNLLNGILADFQGAAGTYYPLLLLWAVRLAGLVILFQFGYVAVQCMRARDFIDFMDELAMMIVKIGLIWITLDHAQDVGNSIIDTGKYIGQQVSGQSPNTLTPSGVYDLGLNTIGILARARSWWMWMHPVDDALFTVEIVFVWVAWACAAAIYLWTLVEAVILVAYGPILLVWSFFEPTKGVLYTWAEGLLGLAVKIITLLGVLAIGLGLAHGWSTELSGLSVANCIAFATKALVESILFVSMVWFLPRVVAGKVHTHLGGGGIGDAGATAMMEHGKTAVGGAAITAAGGSGAQLGQYVQRRLLA